MILRKFIFILFQLSGVLSYTCHAFAKIQEQKLNYNTIYADEHNTLWIGCSNGLFQWKNLESEKIQPVPTTSITAINSINGTLILGTQSGKIYTYNQSLKKVKEVGDLHDEISDIQKSGELICIASKGKGFITITPFEIKRYNTKEGLTDNFIYKIKIDASGIIWSSTDRGINISPLNGPNREFNLNKHIHDRLVTCFDIKDSLLFCGTQRGDICKINLKDSTIIQFDNANWKGAQINDLRILDRSIMVATESGAFCLDNNGHLQDEIIKEKPIRKIEVDKDANIWFCGDRTLIFSTGEQMTLVRSLSGISIDNVHTMTMDHDGNMYFTPDQGLAKYNFAKNNYQKTNITPIVELIDITSTYLSYDGTLWIGTSGKGLYKVDTSNLHAVRILIDRSVETSAILCITGDKEKIWVSSLNGVWYSTINTPDYSFHSLEDEYQRDKYYVYQVKKDSRKDLWLATDGQGILKISKGKIEDFTNDNKIHSNVFYSIEEDAMGQLWFNAYNDGIYCQQGDSLFHLTMNNGLSSNDIISITQYQEDYVVAVSSSNVDIINIHSLRVDHINYEQFHDSIIPETNSITTDRFKNIYIGTNIGILKVYIPSYKSKVTTNAFIEEISVMEKNNPRERNLFHADENYFRFSISSNNNLGNAIYNRYKLEGLSEKWNKTIDNKVVFPRLNPGDYKFILQSANNEDFLNSTMDSFVFTIQYPWWKTSWFMAMSLAVFGLGFYYYVRFREQRISRLEQLEKEKAIAEFETLKHQVNPHFLFNSFNTLMQVIDEDKEKAIEYTQMLSDFYRSLVSYKDVNLVTLDEELILLKKYIYLQKMRFGESLRLHDACSQTDKESIEIPPLTLQLLAENAIKHNVISSNKPLTLTISIIAQQIIVSNNINEKISPEVGENIGHQNIKNRFKLFTKQVVEILKTDQLFEVKLPILKP